VALSGYCAVLEKQLQVKHRLSPEAFLFPPSRACESHESLSFTTIQMMQFTSRNLVRKRRSVCEVKIQVNDAFQASASLFHDQGARRF
jgi:hypothetical protein